MKILGIDPSLSSTGLAVIRSDVPSASTGRVIGKGDGLVRIRQIREHVADWIDSWVHTDLAVIEGPSYGSQGGQKGHHERAGLWWFLADLLDRREVPYVIVPPANRAKYATGVGGGPKAGKDKVLAAVIRRYADVDVDGNDQADALLLAAMGARFLGHPLEPSLPQTHLAAMDAVQWPDREAIAA